LEEYQNKNICICRREEEIRVDRLSDGKLNPEQEILRPRHNSDDHNRYLRRETLKSHVNTGVCEGFYGWYFLVWCVGVTLSGWTFADFFEMLTEHDQQCTPELTTARTSHFAHHL
jgi:hypothetical protein